MDPFAWLFDDQLAEADGIVFGPGFIWPHTTEVVTPGVNELVGSVAGVTSASGALKGNNFATGSAAGATTVAGELFSPGLISSVGRGFIQYAYLDAGTAELRADIDGDAEATANLFVPFDHPYRPLNYELDYGDADEENLFAELVAPDGIASSPRATVYGSLDIPLAGGSDGDSDADMGPADLASKFEGSSTGEGFVSAELYTDGVIELEGVSTGIGVVYHIGDLDFSFTDIVAEAYYQYGNVGVGFDPTDTTAGLDSNAFHDGDITDDFARYLYQYVDVGVGFDYTDDVSGQDGFVSQSYPDGDIIEDWGRFLYQYLNVTTGYEPPDCRLTIGPAPRSPKDLTPTPRPPRKQNR